MVVAALGRIGSASATSAGTQIIVTNTTGAIIPAGTLIHITGTWDNINSVTAPTITPTAIGLATTAPHTPVGSGVTTTAGSGVWHMCWYGKNNSNIAIGGAIMQLDSNQSAGKRVVAAYGWSGVQSTARGAVATATSTSGAPSVATAGPALVAGDLVIGSVSFENNAMMTGDADTLNGSWSAITGANTTGGSAATNVGIGCQGKIVTATGVQTYNPTGGVADTVACVYSLVPVPDPAITQAAYRWYGEGTESGSTALAAQDTAVTGDIANGDATGTLRIRLQETSAVAVPTTDDWQLQYDKNGTTPAATYPDSNRGSNQAVGSTTITSAQSFLGDGRSLARAGFVLWTGGTTGFTGAYKAVLYASTGTYGSGLPTGSALATSTTTLDANTLPSSPNAAGAGPMVYFDFDQTLTLTNGTPYWIGLTQTGETAGKSVAIGAAAGAPATDPGQKASFTGSWAAVGGVDLIFEVYTSAWINVSAVTTVAATYDSPNLTNGAATTNRLTGGTGTFTAGKVSEDSLMDDLGWGASNYTELVYALKIKAADVVAGDTLRFRVLRNGATTNLTYTVTPTINIIQSLPAVTQAAYRFYADGTETGATALAAQDTTPTVDLASGDVNLALRTRLQSTNVAAIPVTDDWQLQWEKNTSGTWTDVTTTVVAEHLADGYDETNAASYSGMYADVTSLAQSFLGNGENLSRAGFWLRKSGSPNGTLRAVLHAHTGTYGTSTGLPTGSPLDTSTTIINCADTATSPVWVEFDFAGTLRLTNGTPYCIGLLSTNTGSLSQSVGASVDDSSATHAGMGAAFGSGLVWNQLFGDMVFRVYTQLGGTVVPYASANLTALADSYASTNRNSFRSIYAERATAQTFVGNGGSLSSVRFFLTRSGSPTGIISAALYATSAGAPTGTALATSSTVLDPMTVSGASYDWFTFDFDGSVVLSNGTTYAIACVSTGGAASGSDSITVGLDSSTPTHSGVEYLFTGTWAVQVADLIFEVYTSGEGAATTNRLGAGSGSFVAGKVSEDGIVNDLGWTGNNYTEVLYSLTLKAADLADGDTLRFRVLRNGAATSMTYTATPTIDVTGVAAAPAARPQNIRVSNPALVRASTR